MLYFELGLPGYGLCLFMYEALGLCAQLLICLKQGHRESLDFTIPLFTNITWMIKESIKNTLSNALSAWSFEYYILLVSLTTNSTLNLSVYSLNFCFSTLGLYFSIGAITYPLTILNQFLGRRQFPKVIPFYKKIVVLILAIMGVYVVLNGGLIYLLKTFISNNIVFPALWKIVPFQTLEIIVISLDCLNRRVMITFEKKCEVITLVIFFGVVGRGIFGYLFIIYLGYGVIGITMSELCCAGLRGLSTLCCILNHKWDKFEGAKHN